MIAPRGGAAAVIAAAGDPAAAIDWQQLVMPGDLAEPHADLESDCAKCHESFDTAGQSPLCLECHEEVAADQKAETGFHSRSPQVRGSECRSCHSDHQGRDFEMIVLDPAAFDHDFTDFALSGAHRGASCDACHEQGTLFREAKSECIDCHSDDDAHAGDFGEDCASCHETVQWKPASFDHSKTEFPLIGEHEGVECSFVSHADGLGASALRRYAHGLSELPPARRRARGPLRKRLCSVPRPPRLEARDLLITRRPTSRSRARTATFAARRATSIRPTKVDLATDCGSCHRLDDVHRGARGAACGDCHSPASWKKTRFDHEQKSGFELRGAHAEVACEACHPAGVEAPIERTGCVGCHSEDDAHAGQLVAGGFDCAECHAEKSWGQSIRFDHGLTRFPLLGLHAAVLCEECHTDTRFADARLACVACHESDDVHRSTLGRACQDCHSPNGWAVWNFDHDTQTSFALRGHHEGLECAACHNRRDLGRRLGAA